MKAIVSEKGQVTIPKEIRDRLGLTHGAVIEFEAVEGKLVGRKALTEDPIAKWRGRGRLPGKAQSVDAYLSSARDADRD
jgi:AbrB family looped-hinge helix DNA binding protein